MKLGWKREPGDDDPGATALAEGSQVDVKRELRPFTDALERAVKARRDAMSQAKRSLEDAQKQYGKLVKQASKELVRSQQPDKLGSVALEGLVLYEDRVRLKKKTYWVTSEVNAVVDSAGNLSRTRRYTLTRFALLGPLALFAPKAKKHDDRQLFLLVEGPDWAEMIELKPDRQAAARQFAQQVNVAARGYEQARERRASLVASANQQLDDAKRNTSRILECRGALEAAHANTGEVTVALGALEERCASLQGEDSRHLRGALKLLQETREELERPLVIPDLPEDAIEPDDEEPGEEDAPDVVPNPDPVDDTTVMAASAGHAAQTGSEPSTLGPGNSEPAQGQDAFEAIRKLGELRTAGLITEAEFEAKKQALLERI